MLLDEPTASLDLCHQLDIVAAVKTRVSGGTTVLAILHDLNLATLLAERIIVLASGRIAAEGPPADTIYDSILSDVFGVTSAVSDARQSRAIRAAARRAKKLAQTGNRVSKSSAQLSSF